MNPQNQYYQDPYYQDSYDYPEESSGLFSFLGMKTKILISLCILSSCLCLCSMPFIKNKCDDEDNIIGYINHNNWTWIPILLLGCCFPPLIVARIALWIMCKMTFI